MAARKQVAGPVLSFRRPSPPFAFVEYAEAESVLRCLEVVNGAAIKMPNGAEKTLLVKADEKTRGRLDEYEKDRVKSEVRVASSEVRIFRTDFSSPCRIPMT